MNLTNLLRKSLFFAVVLYLFANLASCSDSITTNITTNVTTSDNATSPAIAETLEVKPEDSIQFDIISARAIEFPYFDDYQMNILVEFKNTSSFDVYLPEMGSTYDLVDADGNLVSAQNPIYAFPSVLLPGESGYLSNFEIYPESKGNTLTVVPRILAEPATVNPVRYKVTDTKWCDSDFGIKVLGYVENTDVKSYERTYIACFLYDVNGILVDEELAEIKNLAPG